MMLTGYDALRQNAALLDLEGRGVLRAVGPDRTRLLHAMSTNHVEGMKPGDVCYAFFLNAQGHIVADAHLLCTEDAFLIDTELELRQPLFQHLSKYIIADDVDLEDFSDRYAVFAVEGPTAREQMETVGAEVPEDGHWLPWQTRMVAELSATGAPGYRIYVPAGEKKSFKEWMLWSGTMEAMAADLRTVRIENARPRYGEEFGEPQLPQETRLMHALHFTKGCYLGQEIVERIRSRGHVNRILAHVLIEGETAPAAGTKIMVGGMEIGQVASAAFSRGMGKVVAMGYLRADRSAPGTEISVNDVAGVVSDRVPK